jgi:bacterioferritin (cytochrome b1)
MLTENGLWILSYYRTSEISGALFFGRLARAMKAGPVQSDMTKHFADESQHAWYWTSCINQLGAQPLKLDAAYQGQYLAAAGMPANLMEVLAITQVFERRVINQYARHARATNLEPAVRDTLARIMVDEKWHIQWVREALRSLETEYGKEYIEATFKRFWKADQEVYRKTIAEHANRLKELMQTTPGLVYAAPALELAGFEELIAAPLSLSGDPPARQTPSAGDSDPEESQSQEGPEHAG